MTVGDYGARVHSLVVVRRKASGEIVKTRRSKFSIFRQESPANPLPERKSLKIISWDRLSNMRVQESVIDSLMHV